MHHQWHGVLEANLCATVRD